MISRPCAASSALHRPRLQDLRPAENRVERRAELVAERRQELVLHPARPLALDAGGLLASQQLLALAGQLPHRLDACLQRLLGAFAAGDVLEQHGDLASAGRLDAKRRQRQESLRGHQFALEPDRLARQEHAPVQIDPAVGLIGHHLAHLLADDVRDPGVTLVGRVRLDVHVVGQRPMRPVEELDDAEPFVDRVEQRAVAGLVLAQRGVRLQPLDEVGRLPRVQVQQPKCVLVGPMRRPEVRGERAQRQAAASRQRRRQHGAVPGGARHRPHWPVVGVGIDIFDDRPLTAAQRTSARARHCGDDLGELREEHRVEPPLGAHDEGIPLGVEEPDDAHVRTEQRDGPAEHLFEAGLQVRHLPQPGAEARERGQCRGIGGHARLGARARGDVLHDRNEPVAGAVLQPREEDAEHDAVRGRFPLEPHRLSVVSTRSKSSYHASASSGNVSRLVRPLRSSMPNIRRSRGSPRGSGSRVGHPGGSEDARGSTRLRRSLRTARGRSDRYRCHRSVASCARSLTGARDRQAAGGHLGPGRPTDAATRRVCRRTLTARRRGRSASRHRPCAG